MDYSVYVNSAAIGVLGTLLSLIVIGQSLSRKAKLANVVFNFGQFLKDDWLTPIGSLTMIAMALIVLQYVPADKYHPLIIMAFFATAGYTGSDLASRFFSVANKKINAAIDYKTTEADRMSGNSDAPTPTPKP